MRPAREPVFVLVGVDPLGSQGEGVGSTTADPVASTCSRALWLRDETTVVCWPVHVRRRAAQ